MRRASGSPTREINISITDDDLARLRRRADRVHGGSVSAVIHEMVEHLEKQDAIVAEWCSRSE